MKEFATPIAMKCNQEQFDEIRPKLEKLGYSIHCIDSFEKFPYLVFKKALITNISNNIKSEDNRLVFETWNEPLFLALAAMVKGDIINEGEWCWNENHNKPYRYEDWSIDCEAGIELLRPKKATAEQLINYFTAEAQPTELPKLSETKEAEIGKRYLTDDGKVVGVVKANVEICKGCYYFNNKCKQDYRGNCGRTMRDDNKNIWFKLIETPKTITFASEKEMAKFLISGELWDEDGCKFYSKKEDGYLRFYFCGNSEGELRRFWNAYNKTFYLSKPTIKPIDDLKSIAAEAKGVNVEQIKVI